MNAVLDITSQHKETLQSLLGRYLPGVEVWAYGSRIKGTARPASDLDLAAFAAPDQALRVSELKEAFQESNLPFRVDLFVWDDVPEKFKQTIEAEHVVVQSREH
jgi:uncharacterized protein